MSSHTFFVLSNSLNCSDAFVLLAMLNLQSIQTLKSALPTLNVEFETLEMEA